MRRWNKGRLYEDSSSLSFEDHVDKIFMIYSLEKLWFYQPLLSCDDGDITSYDERNKLVLGMPTLQHFKIEIVALSKKEIQHWMIASRLM